MKILMEVDLRDFPFESDNAILNWLKGFGMKMLGMYLRRIYLKCILKVYQKMR